MRTLLEVQARSSDGVRSGVSTLMELALISVVVTYVTASLRSAPGFAYLMKWPALALLGGAGVFASRGRFLLAGVPFALLFAPWYLIALGYQILVGPTTRGVGVAGAQVALVVLTFLILPSALRDHAVLDRFERLLLTTLAVMTLIAIFVGVSDPTKAIVAGSDRFRLRWGFEHVNTAGYLGYVGAILSVRQVWEGRRRFIFPLLLFSVLFIGAGSRGALVAAGVAVSVIASHEVARRWGVGASLVVGFLLASVVVAVLWVAISTESKEGSSYALNELASGRLSGWRNALSRLHSPAQWLLGKGAGQNLNYIGTSSFIGGSSDSFVVDLITRSGMVGFSLWFGGIVGMFLLLTSGYLKALHSGKPELIRRMAFGLALAGSACVAALFEGFVFTVGATYALVIWSVVGGTHVCDPRLTGDPR